MWQCLRLCVKIQHFTSKLWNGLPLCKLIPCLLCHQGLCVWVLVCVSCLVLPMISLFGIIYLSTKGICWVFLVIKCFFASHHLESSTPLTAAPYSQRPARPNFIGTAFSRWGFHTKVFGPYLFRFRERGLSFTVTVLDNAYLVFLHLPQAWSSKRWHAKIQNCNNLLWPEKKCRQAE